VHLFPHSGPTKLGNENHIERHFFSEYRTYDVSLYYNAYLKKAKAKKKKLKLNKQSINLT